jgi:hypothetical protein
VGALKRVIPLPILVRLDALLQWTGALVQVTPSVFVRTCAIGRPGQRAEGRALFQCPACQTALPGADHNLTCEGCGRTWEYRDGIYDFRIKDA